MSINKLNCAITSVAGWVPENKLTNKVKTAKRDMYKILFLITNILLILFFYRN